MLQYSKRFLELELMQEWKKSEIVQISGKSLLERLNKNRVL